LFPLFESAFVDAELAGEDGAGAAHAFAGFADEFGVDCGQRLGFDGVVTKSDFAFAMQAHRFDAFDEFLEDASLSHLSLPALSAIFARVIQALLPPAGPSCRWVSGWLPRSL
jgi:hypothetical protein